jgi:dehydrogenase/reductase SDR family protein 4
LEELKDYSVEGHICNVGKKEERQKLIKHIGDKHGRIDVLVPNVASSTHVGIALEISEAAYDKMWELNVKSTFFTIAECKPLLEKSKTANVMIVSSVGGIRPPPIIGVYGLTKTALNG